MHNAKIPVCLKRKKLSSETRATCFGQNRVAHVLKILYFHRFSDTCYMKRTISCSTRIPCPCSHAHLPLINIFCNHLPRKHCESVEGPDFEMGIFHGYTEFSWMVFAERTMKGVCRTLVKLGAAAPSLDYTEVEGEFGVMHCMGKAVSGWRPNIINPL